MTMLLQLYNGFVAERGEFAKGLRLISCSKEQTEKWKEDCRGPNVLQVNLIIQAAHVRTM